MLPDPSVDRGGDVALGDPEKGYPENRQDRQNLEAPGRARLAVGVFLIVVFRSVGIHFSNNCHVKF